MNTNIIKFMLGCLIIMIGFNFTMAQNNGKEPTKIQKSFLTSAECSDCKDRIESKLNYTKGVVFAELDVPTKMLTVKWNTKKISEDEIKQIVSKIGYAIGDVPADVESMMKLPACCQPNGH